MNEFDIAVVSLKGLCIQALSDLLEQFPSESYEPWHEDLPNEEICSVETEEWRLTFDGSSTHQGGGVELKLYAPNFVEVSLAFKLEFFCTNNEAEYEALVIGLPLS